MLDELRGGLPEVADSAERRGQTIILSFPLFDRVCLAILSLLARKQSYAIIYYLVGSDEIHYFGKLEVVFGGRTSLHRYDSFGAVRRRRSGCYSNFGVSYFIVCGVYDFLISLFYLIFDFLISNF